MRQTSWQSLAHLDLAQIPMDSGSLDGAGGLMLSLNGKGAYAVPSVCPD